MWRAASPSAEPRPETQAVSASLSSPFLSHLHLAAVRFLRRLQSVLTELLYTQSQSVSSAGCRAFLQSSCTHRARAFPPLAAERSYRAPVHTDAVRFLRWLQSAELPYTQTRCVITYNWMFFCFLNTNKLGGWVWGGDSAPWQRSDAKGTRCLARTPRLPWRCAQINFSDETLDINASVIPPPPVC